MKTTRAIDPKARRFAAEAQVKEKSASRPRMTTEEMLRLHHELEVHQIELEMQNEELRAAQTEVEAGLERYSDLYDFAPVGYFNFTSDGTIKMVNLTGARLVGVERAQLVGGRFGALVTEANRADFSSFLERVFGTENGQSCELALHVAGRKAIRVRLEGRLSPDRQECRAVLSDITEHKAMEERLLHSQRMASIGTLSAGIAHDLNNTLTPIVLSASLLTTKVLDPEIREALETIHSSARRGASVVRQLLMYTRGIEGDRVTVQVRHLLREMAAMIRGTFPRELVLELNMDADLQPVLGDPTQLHQVFMNLCLNARDAMPGGGTLSLTATNVSLGDDEVRAHPPAKRGSHVAVTVRDTGHGIPPEDMDRIFEPFFTTKARERGTGLGLSTAYGIVHSHAGFITVDSAPGAGATFTVYLPVTENVSVTAVSSAPEPHGRGELILVVDDEPMICQSLGLVLTHAGYVVDAAGSGAEALATLEKRHGKVRLVMTDVMMPTMGGAKLIPLLRKQQPELKIIAFTGLISPDVKAELVAVGVDEILMKPCGPREILCAVSQLLAAAK